MIKPILIAKKAKLSNSFYENTYRSYVTRILVYNKLLFKKKLKPKTIDNSGFDRLLTNKNLSL